MLRIYFFALYFVAYFQATKQLDADAINCFINAKKTCRSVVGVNAKSTIDSFKQEDVIFSPNKEYLDENCETLLKYVICITKEIKSCPAEISKYVDKQKQVLFQLCDENSDLRKAYVEHHSCLREINEDVLECKSQAEEFVGDNYRGVNETKTINCLKIVIVANKCILGIARAQCAEQLESYGRRLMVMTSYGTHFGCSYNNIGLVELLYQKVISDPSFNVTPLNANP